MLSKVDKEYFNKGNVKNRKFWNRFGCEGEISFKGLKILDLGCGHGSMCVTQHLGVLKRYLE